MPSNLRSTRSTSLKRPYAPMDAKSVPEPPVGPEWQYEPKWDGFRCLIFRTSDDVFLQSKSGQPLARYFPDVVAMVQRLKPDHFALDGEIVIPVAGRLSFDDLLLRVHPAASRVQLLAQQHPAMLVIFDLLVSDKGIPIVAQPLAQRRAALERFARSYLKNMPNIRLSPATTSLTVARRWFRAVGGNLDGIVAKRLDLPYRSGTRDGMQKIKHRQTADCVVGGFRYATGKRVLGSLLLGLYDTEGLLHHVGFTSSFTQAERVRLTALVKPLEGLSAFTGRSPGRPSRWSTRESADWRPLQPKLVVEVEYDHFTGGRFRHGTHLLRWRGDKAPGQCTLEQIEGGRGSTLKLLTAPAKRPKKASPKRR
ncbi:MAG: ATP-dependent DNA ligase [Chlorobia bacterium]|nr:ATP-dependent DNA ligase [Fimbriimonadaceae bacterium]